MDWDLTRDEWETRALKAIQSFPCGSAPGPSGLRPAHLKVCLERAGPTAALKSGLGQFVQAALLGKLPPQLHPFLGAATLVPLNKKDGGNWRYLTDQESHAQTSPITA